MLFSQPAPASRGNLPCPIVLFQDISLRKEKSLQSLWQPEFGLEGFFMAQINVTDLTFGYEGSFDHIFEHVSFSVDTDWRLGFIGRNGKGKTTFLNLLLGKYSYSGAITAPVPYDYFPYEVGEEQRKRCASEFMEELKPGCEEWKVICELDKLYGSPQLLYRPFGTLSFGERTKVLLALLCSGEHNFLLIDEPTNHLDQETKQAVKEYLKGKKGFILTSHDRDLLDACIDHVLVLNRQTIEVQRGNFSSWWENKERRDHFERAENEKHLREIAALRKAADQSGRWARKNESTKIGYDPVKEPDRPTRAYIGGKTKKMEKRVKEYERKMEREIEAKKGLLLDIEQPVPLKFTPLSYHRERLVYVNGITLGYDNHADAVLKDFTFELKRGERVFLHGRNGCGKSTFIKAVLKAAGYGEYKDLKVRSGELRTGSGLKISYVNQDTSFLKGGIREFAQARGLDESLFCALLRKLDMERVQFTKNMEEFSEGQKKKVLLAASLMTPAHLYIWDEPLNYIDVFSRMQIEELLLSCEPAMILVDHDIRFQEKIATRVEEFFSVTHFQTPASVVQ